MTQDELLGDLMGNFRQALIAVFAALARIQHDRRCEEWDDLSERLFDILVCDAARDLALVEVRFMYGGWGRHASPPPHIGVEVHAPGAVVWIGTVTKWEDDGEGREVEWSEQTLTDRSLRFAFREFDHPNLPPDAMGAFEFISGHTVDDMVGIPQWSRVGAHASDCRFFVWRSTTPKIVKR